MTLEEAKATVRLNKRPAIIWEAHTWGRSSVGVHYIQKFPIQLYGKGGNKGKKISSLEHIEKLLSSFEKGRTRWEVTTYLYMPPDGWAEKFPNAKILE